MEPSVELERFAALSAEIEAGAARDEVCAREGISVEAWTGAQEAWLSRMAEETAAKRFDLTNRYNAAFVARRLALQDGKRKSGNKPGRAEKKPSAAQKARDPAPAPPAKVEGLPTFMEAQAAAATPIVAPPPARVEGLPSFMEAAAATPPPPLAGPVMAMPPPPLAAPPPMVSHAPPFSAPPLEDHKGADPANMTVVAAVSPFAQKSALPFQGSGAPQAPAANRPSGAQRGGLPFHAAAPSPQGAPSAPAKHTPSAPPPPPGDQEFGGATVIGAISPFALGEALPFRGGAGAPAAPAKHSATGDLSGLPFRAGAAGAAPSQPPPMPPPRKPAPDPSAADPVTAPIAPIGGAPSSARSSALPFKPGARGGAAASSPQGAPGAASRTRFSLEQFASLAAEIAATPAKVAEVRARYGLDEDAHRREAEAWNQRFSQDPELYRRYGALFKSYRDWLSRTPR